ncbi:MAG TPA: PVC-type heme-binding CxxCH protein [Gemmataceae bacterium]|nr:PVC-type heme-binding CxxCH protein [Gemmataceae bacterium]
MNNLRLLTRVLLILAGLSNGIVWAQGFTPEEAVKRMKLPEGFQVKLVASEPEVRQPVSMSFDDRGRLWVVQYLQYPTPAGLKPVKVDQYLRTVYDRVPEPPPRGPKGADKITIFEDVHGDGHYRKVRDFVTGLNLASGMAIGHGGVYVVQPPYLLFYPDRNGDDIPDGDPEVLLTGFGMEDAHAFANSLQWGPDGWLYGAQGSTVTANIRGISFQQGIWRYHPITREFELFAEGGGNTWGLDFDPHGNIFASTNYGHSALLHQVQGAYYIKGFSKHGELHNPYAFGYFDHVPYKGFKGGHVTIGGIVYQGGSFPKQFNNTFIAANVLSNAIYWHVLETQGSSFTAHFGGDLLIANDTWFRPVDCLVGPDGSLYIADWYDKRANHVDPVDNWDRTNGRIYKIEAKGTPPAEGLPLRKRTSMELLGLLSHRNDWYVHEARRLLAERRDPTVIPILRKMILENRGQLALEALWALYVSGGFDDGLAQELLCHTNPDVRAWTVRLLGDARKVSPALQARLVVLARSESQCTVRNQLACTCKRLPGKDALPIVFELLQRSEDVSDPQIPLLLWWALEDKADSDRERILALFDAPSAWHNPLVRKFIVSRLSRRYMAAGSAADLTACSRLLAVAPGPAEIDLVISGMDQALQGHRLRNVPAELAGQIADLLSRRGADLTLLRLGLRMDIAQAYERAIQVISDPKAPAGKRISLIDVLGQLGKPECVPILLQLLRGPEATSVRAAVLTALQPFPDARIAEQVLAMYPQLPPDLRPRAQTLLCGRLASARDFLRAVDRGRIDAKEVPFDQLRRIMLHNDEELNQLVQKHWGSVGKETAGAKRARINSIKHMLGMAPGDLANGKQLFQKTCATCHTLFGEGNKIGPELTGADRKDLEFLVTSIVDPSAVIRKEYLAYVVATNNGRLLTGLLAESTPKTITLLDEKNQRTILAREDIETLKPSPLSLMPEKLLDPFSDQDIRDFFSYLQSDGRVPAAAAQAKRSAPPLKVCLVSGSVEYKSDESLAAFQKYLEEHYKVHCTRAFRKADDDLPGLENLETCDVMLLFTRRLTISGEQLARIKKYCRSGKPIVAVRTASHAFQNWLALDKEILGGNYGNHYGAGAATQVQIAEKARMHPILQGVEPFRSVGSLYKNTGLAADDEVLLTGSIPGHTEPIAWTRLNHGARVFYTSLGHPDDFKEPSFLHLLTNALFWTAGKELPR